jgi:hypothetical protein
MVLTSVPFLVLHSNAFIFSTARPLSCCWQEPQLSYRHDTYKAYGVPSASKRKFRTLTGKYGGRDSKATRYRLDGPGIESRWGARLSASVQTGPGAHPTSYTKGTGCFLGVKRPGRGADHQPSNAEVKEKVELYLYSSLVAFVACSRVNFTFPFTLSRETYEDKLVHGIRTRSKYRVWRWPSCTDYKPENRGASERKVKGTSS